jgi:D-glycero-alpha-D-manno-heptose-7-phosphate kinase
MILTSSPLRVPLGGGGTDLPSYYEQHGGFLISAAIDKHVYINVHRRFSDGFLLKYSELEEAATIEDIRHPIIREALRAARIEERNLEIASMADIPAGTELGSSGSFTTALLKALHTYKKHLIHPRDLAEEACHIEIGMLKESIGKQDQYIAAYGGITCFEFERDGNVRAWPLALSEETVFDLEDNLLLFFTGYSRSASKILKDQDERSRQNDSAILDQLHYVKELAYQSKNALECGDLAEFAHIMDVHWQHKRKRSAGMTNSDIDEMYAFAMNNGALGGKLIGAGGGGFLMLYAREKSRLRDAMRGKDFREVRFRFDFQGTRIISQE